MENNKIMTAKEWLEKRDTKNITIEIGDINESMVTFDTLDLTMERYANYKNRILEDRIKKFRKVIIDNAYPEIPVAENAVDPITMNAWHDYASTNITIKEYDKHFNIK